MSGPRPSNIVRLPRADHSIVADFLRYHVLVKVHGGNADAWLAELLAKGGESGDIRFARWIRASMRRDPRLLDDIRRMVDTTPFWCAAGGMR